MQLYSVCILCNFFSLISPRLLPFYFHEPNAVGGSTLAKRVENIGAVRETADVDGGCRPWERGDGIPCK